MCPQLESDDAQRESLNLEPELKSFANFLNEFNAESDRGAALTAVAMLDDVLCEILCAFLVDCSQTEALVSKPHAPLSTLAARADACHALGLLNPNEHAEITTIRRIRNEFAHSWNKVSFSDGKVMSLAHSLPWLGPTELVASSSARSRFDIAVVILLMDLLWRARLAQKQKRSVTQWPKHFHTYRDLNCPHSTTADSGTLLNDPSKSKT